MKDQDHSPFLAAIRRVTATAGECGFAGAVALDRLPLIPDRLIIKGIIASGMWQAGDHRDWPAVQAWAEFIASRLCGQNAGSRATDASGGVLPTEFF